MNNNNRWEDLRKLIPYQDVALEVDTLHGRYRKAVRTRNGFVYTDCTHPLANTHLADYAILRWRYQDESLVGGYVNRNEIRKDGESILTTAFKPHPIKAFFLKLLKQLK